MLRSYLAVDDAPATEHRVVGVLLHGRPAGRVRTGQNPINKQDQPWPYGADSYGMSMASANKMIDPHPHGD